jgi:hypothetical protein
MVTIFTYTRGEALVESKCGRGVREVVRAKVLSYVRTLD